MVSAKSAETRGRRRFGETSRRCRARRNRQERLGGNERGRDRGAPRKTGYVGMGLEQSCFGGTDRVGRGPGRDRYLVSSVGNAKTERDLLV